VGAVLEVSGFHPGRSGRDHLRVLATMARLPGSRVEEVLRLVELDAAAGRRAGGYSLGMRQRLALAAALLGDPELLVLDEPANGLDPPGIRWLRDVLRAEADAGRTVLVSSHMLAEVAQTVDDVVVIARGRRVFEGPIAGLTQGGGLTVEGEDPARLGAALERAGATVRRDGDRLLVHGLPGRGVSAVARDEGLLLDVLAPRSASLEDVFLELTGDAAPQEVGR
jgi:ABC-2 type transport system ATP-binding protein